MIKVSLVFQTFHAQTKAQLLLGLDVFKRMFVQAKTIEDSTSENPKSFSRVIGEEVMGKVLPPGTGPVDKSKATMDPAMCSHPTKSLAARGSAKAKWWTCKLCLMRWERIPLNAFEPRNPIVQDLDILTFGKYAGQSFKSVWDQDQDYCQSILKSVESGDYSNSTLMKRFAQYIVTKESQMESTFVAVEDPFKMEEDDC